MMRRSLGLARAETAHCHAQIFADLPRHKLEQIDALLRPMAYEKGEAIYHAGSPVLGLYIVCEGIAKLVAAAPCGKRRILKLVAPGDTLGEEGLFGQEAYFSHAYALTPLRLCLLERDAFMALVAEEASISLRLIESLARDVKLCQERLLETVYEDSEERIARMLLSLGLRFGTRSRQGIEIALDLSRAELAELAGIAPETAIRILSRLKDEDFVTLKGSRVVLQNPEALRSLIKTSTPSA